MAYFDDRESFYIYIYIYNTHLYGYVFSVIVICIYAPRKLVWNSQLLLGTMHHHSAVSNKLLLQPDTYLKLLQLHIILIENIIKIAN